MFLIIVSFSDIYISQGIVP